MLDKVASVRALKRLFRRFPVADLNTLSRTLDTRSRMSIFRRLKDFGYFSSYTHAGSFIHWASAVRLTFLCVT